MIELQDAIERAKLSADDSGYVSNYIYDQLIDQLQVEDQYAFTMALVDLGIHTKLASDHYSSISEVIYDEEEFDSRQVDIIEEFVRIAQQYVQSPGGLWVPDTYQQDQTQTQDPQSQYESFLEQTPFVYPNQEQQQQMVESEFTPSGGDVSQFIDVLEQAGMFIDAQGNVTSYQQNIPGLFTEKTKWAPMPLEKAIDKVNAEADNIDKEQSRIQSLQDTLSALSTDFPGSEDSDLISSFEDSFQSLESFKYSDKSTDENIRSIAEGLTYIRDYIGQLSPAVENIRGIITDLKGRLDTYYQSQYDLYDQKLNLINALEELKNLKDTDPQGFQNAIQGMGGVSASMFIRAFEGSYMPEYGSLNIEVGYDWVKNQFEVLDPGRGVLLTKQFINQGGFGSDEYLKDDLIEYYGLDTPKGSQTDVEINFDYTSGSDVEAEKGMWYYEDPDPDVGIRGGWVIEDTVPVPNVDFIEDELLNNIEYFYQGGK